MPLLTDLGARWEVELVDFDIVGARLEHVLGAQFDLQRQHGYLLSVRLLGSGQNQAGVLNSTGNQKQEDKYYYAFPWSKTK